MRPSLTLDSTTYGRESQQALVYLPSLTCGKSLTFLRTSGDGLTKSLNRQSTESEHRNNKIKQNPLFGRQIFPFCHLNQTRKRASKRDAREEKMRHWSLQKMPYNDGHIIIGDKPSDHDRSGRQQ